jgi:hypothetical protein
MKPLGPLAFVLLLAACGGTPPPTVVVAPGADSAGAQGEAYCQTVPSDPVERQQWDELCQEQGR